MGLFSFVENLVVGSTKISFRQPKAAAVVNLDGRTVGSCLDQILLSEISHNSLDFRSGQAVCIFYFSPSIFFRAIQYLWSLWRTRTTHKLSLNGMFRVAYYIACLHVIRPRVVIDFVHNPDVIHFAKHYPAAQYFCIQNGYCCDPLDHKMDDGQIQNGQFQYLLAAMKPIRATNIHIFCFGEKDVDLFIQLGLGEDQTGIRYHACGPLKADFYLNEHLKGVLPREEFDICYSSQVSGDFINSPTDFCRTLMRSNELIVEYLRQYNMGRGLRIAIAMRSVNYAVEEQFFRTRLGAEKGFFYGSRKNDFSSYSLMARSRVVVGLNSTMGFDAIGWGKKALFAPFHLQSVYRMSSQRYKSDADMWKWFVSGFTYEEFETKLDQLLAISQEQYIQEMQGRAHALSSYGRKLPAHTYIRQMILEACERSSIGN